MAAEKLTANPRIDFFNYAAVQWDESLTPEETVFLRCLIDKAASVQNSGKRVLDIGCGTGILFPFLENFEVVALDISEEMLKRAKQKHLQHVVQYICGSAEALSFPENFFCYCYDVICLPAFRQSGRFIEGILQGT